MEPLTLAILKAVATTVIKLYITSLFGDSGSRLAYNKSDLGYKVPKWYMEVTEETSTFYAFGTSVRGDEFESVDDAVVRAQEQMANGIRLSNQKIVGGVHYDATSVKQKRLVEMFLRSEGLEDYVRMNSKVDRKELVKVPGGDMRAFVRIALPQDQYVAYQTTWLHELKTKIIQQKTEDIMAEMDHEIQTFDQNETTEPPPPPPTNPVPPPPSAMTPPPPPATAPQSPSPVPGADQAFDELDQDAGK